MDLYLARPSIDYKASYLDALSEYQMEYLPRLADLDLEKITSDFAGFAEARLAKEGRQSEAHMVPETELWGILQGQYAGRISIRHYLNDALRVDGGHIGYDTRPSFRGMGVASSMLAQALPVARKLGLTEVLLTCNDDNDASARVIEKNGGVLKNKIHHFLGGPSKRCYWIKL